MSWLHERREVASERNACITCERWFGRWKVCVGGLEQTSPFLNGLWSKCIRRVPKGIRAKRVLLLGLGAGGLIRILGRHFPKASVVAVEWDARMATLGKELGFIPRGAHLEVIIDDASAALHSLTGQFDIIICDLFIGKELSKHYHDPAFISALRERISDGGWLVVNGYNHSDVFSQFNASFFERKRFKIITNWFALFRPHHAGNVGEAPDLGFRRAWTSPEYLHREIDGQKGMEVVSRGTAVGIRRKIGPFVLDTFRGTEEPQDDETATGIANWQPISKPTSTNRWIPVPLFFDRRRTGYLRLPEDADFHRWSESALRKLRAAETKGFGVSSISCETYLASLKESDLPKNLIRCFTTDVARKYERHGERLHCFAVRDEEGNVSAGLAVVDVPEISLSLHVSAFTRKGSNDPSSGVALIGAWIRHASDHGFTFMDFDALWRPGEDRSWRGFGRFKERFGLRKIDYCWPRIRMMRLKK